VQQNITESLGLPQKKNIGLNLGGKDRGRQLHDESLTIYIPSKTLQDDNIKDDLHGGEINTMAGTT
jgi:hypothetical protein